MHGSDKSGDKKIRYKWDEYEAFGSEPSYRSRYDLSPELEDELLDKGYLLKRRVWRHMKKIQKHARSTRNRYANIKSDRTHHLRRRPLHSF